METLQVPNLDKVKLIAPNYLILLELVSTFTTLKGLEFQMSWFPERDNLKLKFAHYLGQLFEIGKQEEHKGLVQDFFTWLAVLGVPYKPYMICETK